MGKKARRKAGKDKARESSVKRQASTPVERQDRAPLATAARFASATAPPSPPSLSRQSPPAAVAASHGPTATPTVTATTDPARLAARLADVSSLVRRRLARSDAGDGMTRARLSALSLLLLGGPRTLGRLAAAEQVRPPTMTRLVAAMEADGLVRRERNAADGRSIVVSATEAGARLCIRGRRDQLRDLARLLGGLGAVEAHAADEILARLEGLLRQPDSGARD